MTAILPWILIAGILGLCGCSVSHSGRNECGYAACPQRQPGKLNIHVVCHSHDDVGWVKTVDQYYVQDVQNILNTAIPELLANEDRRFIYVEMAFFWRWWNQQNEVVRNQVKYLVNRGQLEFINGGWCMEDEATAHYQDIIDQMTLGHQFLLNTFGACAIPKIGWQIDPFGHSRQHAALFSQMGFDGLFFTRLDYQDLEKRNITKTMETVWQGSSSLGESSNIFTGILPNSKNTLYFAPNGFCYDIYCSDPPIQNDPRIKDVNAYGKAWDFIRIAETWSQQYNTEDLMIVFGGDFHFQGANKWYTNLDKLIDSINDQQTNGSRVNAFYSTPSCYTKAVNEANFTWTKKSDDFFPYGSNEFSYWTGYFTSRPAFKGLVRYTTNFLQVCKQLRALVGLDPFETDIGILKRYQAEAQHHDAVTGTEKQHVVNDYTQSISTGLSACENLISEAFGLLTNDTLDYKFCRYLNVSFCPPSEKSKTLVVTAYNPLGWEVESYVRFPVSGLNYRVTGPDGKVAWELVPLPFSLLELPERNDSATKEELLFPVTLPPLGFVTHIVEEVTDIKPKHAKTERRQINNSKGTFVFQNEFVAVGVDLNTGLLASVTNLEENIELPISQNFHIYLANTNWNGMCPSGAYAFSPNGTAKPAVPTAAISLFRGSLVQELHQKFNDWISQVIRIYKNSRDVEFEWLIGPIPVQEDNIGREIITRFDTPLFTEGTFYTDSNGKEMIERKLNFQPTYNMTLNQQPIAGNYYPVNNKASLKDTNRNIQLDIVTDRAQGCSSLNDGQLEIMLHRRLLHDDYFGVEEPLNETGTDGKGLIVRGKMRLLVNRLSGAARISRPLVMRSSFPPTLSFSEIQARHKKPIPRKIWSLDQSLPPNVHLLSLERQRAEEFLLRLEHIYENNEDGQWSQPATINLQDLFPGRNVTAVTEMSLTANQRLTDVHRMSWLTEGQTEEDIKRFNNPIAVNSEEDLTVVLNPTEIKTFIVQLDLSG